MRRIFLASAVLVSLASLSACGSSDTEDNKLTETQMDDLEGLEGTISDDMINTDEMIDEAPVDPAPADAGVVKSEKPKAKPDESEADEPGEPDPAKIEAESAAE